MRKFKCLNLYGGPRYTHTTGVWAIDIATYRQGIPNLLPNIEYVAEQPYRARDMST